MEEEQKKEKKEMEEGGGGDKGREEKDEPKRQSLVLGRVSLSQPGDELKANYSVPAWVLSLSLILLSTA